MLWWYRSNNEFVKFTINPIFHFSNIAWVKFTTHVVFDGFFVVENSDKKCFVMNYLPRILRLFIEIKIYNFDYLRGL